MSAGKRRREGGRPQLLMEVSVAGPLGPVLRTAFSDRRITTQSESTVIRTGPSTDRDLTDLVHALVERGLVVQCVRRLTDDPPKGGRTEPSTS